MISDPAKTQKATIKLLLSLLQEALDHVEISENADAELQAFELQRGIIQEEDILKPDTLLSERIRTVLKQFGCEGETLYLTPPDSMLVQTYEAHVDQVALLDAMEERL